jgi:hypothetical protein
MVHIVALRSPPILSPSVSGVLFENHWLYWIALAVGGIILLAVANSRADKRLFKVGLAGIALAVLWAAAAFFVITPAERLFAAHAAMAEAAAHNDVDTLLSHMEPQAAINNLNLFSGTDSPAAREQIESSLKRVGIRQTHFTTYHVSLGAGVATTHFVAVTESDNGAIKSEWEILWTDNPNSDWRVTDATLLKLGDQPVSGLLR